MVCLKVVFGTAGQERGLTTWRASTGGSQVPLFPLLRFRGDRRALCLGPELQQEAWQEGEHVAEEAWRLSRG